MHDRQRGRAAHALACRTESGPTKAIAAPCDSGALIPSINPALHLTPVRCRSGGRFSFGKWPFADWPLLASKQAERRFSYTSERSASGCSNRHVRLRCLPPTSAHLPNELRGTPPCFQCCCDALAAASFDHAKRVGGSAVARSAAASDHTGRFCPHFRSQAGTRSKLIARLNR